MEMTLKLPSNYVEIEEEEMLYLDGGFYISNHNLKNVIFFAVTAITDSYLLRIGVAKAATYVAGVVSRFVSKVGAMFGGPIGGLVGYVIGWFSGWEIGFKTCSALYSNKGLDIGWGGISVR